MLENFENPNTLVEALTKQELVLGTVLSPNDWP
jgi:hypothetical protein